MAWLILVGSVLAIGLGTWLISHLLAWMVQRGVWLPVAFVTGVVLVAVLVVAILTATPLTDTGDTQP